MTLKVSEVVELKSGGGHMTVERVDGDEVHCVWRDKNKVFRDVFHESLLRYPPKAAIGMLGLTRR